jgi:TolB protein
MSNLIKITLIFVILAFQCSYSYGGLSIDITSPVFRKTPLAVAIFVEPSPPKDTHDEEIGKRLRETLLSDMEFSGLFEIIDSDYPLIGNEEPGSRWSDVDFAEWRITGSELLITGRVLLGPTDCKKMSEISVELRLFDLSREKMVVGRKYCGRKNEYRWIAHRFANTVMKELTGERGVFESRLAFVSSENGVKEIFISDYDGYNIHPVTANGSINISPRWSPDGRWLLYTSFKEGQPKLFIKNPFTGKEYRIAEYKGINIGARWSPSGRKIVLTLSIDGNPELYSMDLSNRKLKRLTNSWGIDVSPTWSPDGKRIAFVSDRGGSPQIYVIDAVGKRLKRLTYKGRYNVSPAWSPRGDWIAFCRLNRGRFDIWLISPDGSKEKQLTHGPGNNEDPSWSRDGRYIVFTSDRDKNPCLYIMRTDGSGQRKIVKGETPSWSP